MNKVNVGLIRLLQFVVFAFFTFIVLTYFGILLLLPLDAVVLLVKLMSVFGLNSLIGAVIAVPLIGYLLMSVYKAPGVGKMLLDIGIDLVNTGKARVEEFNKKADEIRVS